MTRVTVHEYAASLSPRYRTVRRAEKGRILEEFCKATGMHRKAAIRLLGGVRPLKAGRKPRMRKYGAETAEALKRLWEVGDRMCGKLLKGAIPELLEALERHALRPTTVVAHVTAHEDPVLLLNVRLVVLLVRPPAGEHDLLAPAPGNQ